MDCCEVYCLLLWREEREEEYRKDGKRARIRDGDRNRGVYPRSCCRRKTKFMFYEHCLFGMRQLFKVVPITLLHVFRLLHELPAHIRRPTVTLPLHLFPEGSWTPNKNINVYKSKYAIVKRKCNKIIHIASPVWVLVIFQIILDGHAYKSWRYLDVLKNLFWSNQRTRPTSETRA